MSTRTYEIYPNGGRFSNQSVNYHGELWIVAATSIRQAYACAYNRRWVNPSSKTPVGIVYIWDEYNGQRLWCGCHRNEGDEGQVWLRPGAGLRMIRQCLAQHSCKGPIIEHFESRPLIVRIDFSQLSP